MASNHYDIRPLDILRREHVRLLDEIDGLLIDTNDHGNRNAERTAVPNDRKRRLSSTLRLLECHQQAEERYLFPLVYEIGEKLLADLREDHLFLLNSSDMIVSTMESGESDGLCGFLETLKDSLKSHFSIEEKSVFEYAEKVLSRVQVDILRIKLASTPVVKI